jgi:hypothetical protein
MREITQRRGVTCRMVQRIGYVEHLHQGGEPMQTIRAAAIAIPFVGLAILVGVLSLFLGVGQ